jgi:hypothetical protein
MEMNGAVVVVAVIVEDELRGVELKLNQSM